MTESDTSPGLPTINDELLIDIYANPILDSLVIMIDRPFVRPLSGLELTPATGRLLFVFGAEKRDLGDTLGADLLPYFLKRDKIEICQMDLKTRKPVAAQQVPLKITQ